MNNELQKALEIDKQKVVSESFSKTLLCELIAVPIYIFSEIMWRYSLMMSVTHEKVVSIQLSNLKKLEVSKSFKLDFDCAQKSLSLSLSLSRALIKPPPPNSPFS
mgnify:CR=1 FL=1